MAYQDENGNWKFDDENNALGWGNKALMRQALGGQQPIAYGTGFTTAQTTLAPTIQSNIDYIKAANARYLQPQTATTTTSATTTPVTNAGTFNWKGLLPWNWGKDTVIDPGVINFDTIKIVDQLTPEQIQANFGKTIDEWNALPLSERTSAFNQLRYQNALDKLVANTGFGWNLNTLNWGLNAANSLVGAWNAWKGAKQADRALALQEKALENNLINTERTYNTKLFDTGQARAAAGGFDWASYYKLNRLKQAADKSDVTKE